MYYSFLSSHKIHPQYTTRTQSLIVLQQSVVKIAVKLHQQITSGSGNTSRKWRLQKFKLLLNDSLFHRISQGCNLSTFQLLFVEKMQLKSSQNISLIQNTQIIVFVLLNLILIFFFCCMKAYEKLCNRTRKKTLINLLTFITIIFLRKI